MKYELIMWLLFFLKKIPGKIGCKVRKLLLPCKIGNNSFIWDNVHIDNPSRLKVGDNVSINRGTILHAGGGIEIGDDVLIGPCVTIYSQNHAYESRNALIRQQGYEYKKVVIGEDVWIASGVTILPGVTIGKGCVVAANSVVVHDIPEFQVVAGIPAKLKRHR